MKSTNCYILVNMQLIWTIIWDLQSYYMEMQADTKHVSRLDTPLISQSKIREFGPRMVWFIKSIWRLLIHLLLGMDIKSGH